ncbi:MAG TPA: bifunctional pyr operon transcriptional regulator/uracil phosphoribosyltransferase PyrR [Thermodesulfobacteriota bacterium]|nr:bifunctional pyr operon transcriptional regulator/uracil phosphoribosyltransferase PyrR [Thermodesulfobacteriota bacterium]
MRGILETVSKQIVLGENDIEGALDQICKQLLSRHPQLNEMVLVGIRTGGVFLAERLKQKILQERGISLPTGIIDITLYRGDWTRLSQTPEVKKTEIHFPIEDKHVLLVDDAFFTGRTIRAALDALLDLGRPRRVEFAALIDRGHRELPICADYTGKTLEKISRQDSANVELEELAGVDQVVIEYGKYPYH